MKSCKGKRCIVRAKKTMEGLKYEKILQRTEGTDLVNRISFWLEGVFDRFCGHCDIRRDRSRKNRVEAC